MNITALLRKNFRYGIMLGLGFCAYTVFMWITRLDSEFLSVGQYLDVAIVLMPLLIVIHAIRTSMERGNLTVVNRFVIAIFVGLVSMLIYDPFLYTYHHYINPDWYSAVLKLKEMQLKEAHTDPAVIAEMLEKMKTSRIARAGLFETGTIIASVIVLPVLISLLSLIFVRMPKSS